MRTLAARLNAFSRWLSHIALIFSCSFMMLMLICVLVQIVARYIFAEPPAWTEELARYAMVWSGFLGATVAFYKRADPALTNISTLPEGFIQSAARWIEIAAVTVLCCAILIATPSFFELHLTRVSETLEAPSYVIVSVIPISVAIILFHTFVRAVNLLSGDHSNTVREG